MGFGNLEHCAGTDVRVRGHRIAQIAAEGYCLVYEHGCLYTGDEAAVWSASATVGASVRRCSLLDVLKAHERLSSCGALVVRVRLTLRLTTRQDRMPKTLPT